MGSSPLLRIPPELRNRIYEDVFAQPTFDDKATDSYTATPGQRDAVATIRYRTTPVVKLDKTCANSEQLHHIIADTSVSRSISINPGIWSTLADRWSELAAEWLGALGAEAVTAMEGFNVWFVKEKGVGRNACILKAEVINGRANMEKIDKFIPCSRVFILTGASVVAEKAEVVKPKMVSCFNRVLEVYEDSGALIESPGFDAYRTKEQMRVKPMSAITGGYS
ncbi:hypothetical protein LTR56_013382 [Elasticomyces elasticus]|nr:hypothetical protein LTR56_013382 [Elasticomyces elasticus]KAK3665695.1 hypothetical protein LTR22_003326 [Elasticomyces elasticus]KAK4910002.1 hypothetical protein LTR49_021276 [Elasticomyces elasticus]KAK5757241.1 hypothetical protein LTS12_012599 [Elasticomyces elasticus]